jgi:hypothetical protein
VWTVGLASDFITASDGTKRTTIDYALRRIIVQDDGAHSMVNTSLYGFVDFFAAETYNRRVLNRILSGAGVKEHSQDAFWTQSELHVMDSADGVPALARKSSDNGAVFSYEGMEVASYVLSAQSLTKSQSDGLAHYLTTNTTLHPNIIAEISGSGLMPASITYILSPMHNGEKIVMTFKSATPAKVVYPLRKDLNPEPPEATSNAGALQGTISIMIAAAHRLAPGLLQESDFHAAIDEALGQHHAFQGLVLMFEMSEQYGEHTIACAAPCHGGNEIVAAAKADPRSNTLIATLQPKNKEEMEAAISTLRAMKRDDLSNAYVIDEFLANDLVEMGRVDEALPLFAAAIKGNPFLAGYYKDVGDAYRTSFHPDFAWFYYDVGRTLPGGADAPVISQMNKYEAQLETRYPQFF